MVDIAADKVTSGRQALTADTVLTVRFPYVMQVCRLINLAESVADGVWWTDDGTDPVVDQSNYLPGSAFEDFEPAELTGSWPTTIKMLTAATGVQAIVQRAPAPAG